MNPINLNYDLLVKKYQKIEKESTESDVHERRVILKRIFFILIACKIDPSGIKNGEKAFKLFGKLRDLQFQVSKLESVEHTLEITEYFAFLKERESRLIEKVSKFCKKKRLRFPTIERKSDLNKYRIRGKAEKSLSKLIGRIQSTSIEEFCDIDKIRIEFKKFRYIVQILSYLDHIEKEKLDMMKMYQDKLGEIQDYEILMDGIKKYCKKRKLDADEMIGIFETDQNTLIENFDNQIELFIVVCRDVIGLN